MWVPGAGALAQPPIVVSGRVTGGQKESTIPSGPPALQAVLGFCCRQSHGSDTLATFGGKHHSAPEASSCVSNPPSLGKEGVMPHPRDGTLCCFLMSRPAGLRGVQDWGWRVLPSLKTSSLCRLGGLWLLSTSINSLGWGKCGARHCTGVLSPAAAIRGVQGLPSKP